MAWTAPLTWTANTILTAAQLNTHLRDNLNETLPAKATNTGSMFVSNGPNSMVERFPREGYVATAQSTTSLTYVDLATAGPSVTVTTGTRAFVAVYARMSNTTAGIGGQALMSWAISGATTRAAQDNTAIEIGGLAASCNFRTTAVDFLTDLTAGSNTFTAKYRIANASTATFADRRILVIPF
jgi:hypothetical protein